MGRILDSPQFSGTIQFLTGTFTASAGTTVDLSASTLKLPANCLTAAMLPLMTGDTGQGAGGASGAVPAPPLGSAAGGMFLAANGQWAVPAAGLPAGTALVLSPMTTAGDMIVGGANGAATRLPAPAAGTAGTQTLQWTAAGGIAWGVAAAGGGGGIADAPSNGVLYGRENGGWVEVPAGGGGTLAGLSDVDETTAPANGQALVYSASEEKWKPGTVAASGGGGGSGAGGVSIPLTYVSDGDENGLFYFLGQTRDGTWANPQTLGLSGVGFYTVPPGLGQNNGSISDLTSRANSGLYLGQADPNGLEIDIGPNRAFCPNNVTITNRSGYDGTALQAVNLYGSQDGVNFTLLGNLPVALNLQNSSQTCPVVATKAYRYFRLLRNGLNNANTEYFCIGQVEMYGTLYVGAPSTSQTPQIVQSVFGRGGGGFNITLPNPPQAGNTLLFFGYGSQQNPAFPAGVVFVAGGAGNANSSQALWVGMRVAAAGEAATNWNFGSGDWFNGAILEVSGVGGMTTANYGWGPINSTDVGAYLGLLSVSTLKIGILEWDNGVDPTMYNLPPGVLLQNNATYAGTGGNHCACFWAWKGPGYMTSFTIPNVSRPTYLGIEISGPNLHPPMPDGDPVNIPIESSFNGAGFDAAAAAGQCLGARLRELQTAEQAASVPVTPTVQPLKGAEEVESKLHELRDDAQEFLDALKLGVNINIGERIVEGIGEIAAKFKEAVAEGVNFNSEVEGSVNSFASTLQSVQPAIYATRDAAKGAAADVFGQVRSYAIQNGLDVKTTFEAFRANYNAFVEAGATDTTKQIQFVSTILSAEASKGIDGQRALRDSIDLLQGRFNNLVFAKEIGVTADEFKRAAANGHAA